MRKRICLSFILLSSLSLGCVSQNVSAAAEAPATVSTATARPVETPRPARRRKSKSSDFLKKEPEWYKGEEAKRIAGNILFYQRDCGGWWKNLDYATELTSETRRWVLDQKEKGAGTIDNGATFREMQILARMYDATGDEVYKAAFLKGMDFLLDGQYPNGGWPQCFPNPTGYSVHITFNDNAMIGAMSLLRDIAQGKEPYEFVDQARRDRAEKAVAKGIECILKCQVVVDGKRTVWCAQHDATTFEPQKARSYELPSLSGAESVGITFFLMGIDEPSTEVIQAIESAVSWYDQVRIAGKAFSRLPSEPGQRRGDIVLVDDPDARPLWARFYEIGTNRPMFSDRDGVVKYDISEIGYERRTGYSWYGSYAKNLLPRDYPEWREKWTPGRDVLTSGEVER
ncbi:pectate lyase [Candidatus Sumerlaeota bacterium]|nr:pectate lyase [Candidatus Sumerlaeota bacterium]